MNEDLMKLFGLTEDQSQIMYSFERLVAMFDVLGDSKHSAEKKQWINEWTHAISRLFTNRRVEFFDRQELREAVKAEFSKNPNNSTWYYLLLLETIVFIPYTPLGEEEDKQYKKIKFKKQTDFIKELVKEHGIASPEIVDRFEKMYSKAVNRIGKKSEKLAFAIVGAVAVAGVAAAAAAIGAGPIAVALVGDKFIGLSGIALTNACLAMLGGGAISIGGAGVIGGIATIAGGGALLGLAGGGAASAGVLTLLSSSPKIALSQAAKMEVIMKEILLNAQHDIQKTQEILAKYKESILNLNHEVEKLKMEDEKNKEKIKALSEALDYLKRAYSEMNKFSSAFKEGLDSENRTV